LGAFWHTEFGPLNQVIHVYPYDDLQQRTAVRAALAQDTAMQQLPGGGDLIVAQESEIMNPAPFMRPLGSRDYGTGNVYEMRIYTFAPGDIPKVLDGWAKAIDQKPYPVTAFAHGRLVSEAMRSIICISLFQASQHASRMAS
jgi:hypothetical protein